MEQTLGDWLRSNMARYRGTTVALAAKLGISHTTVSRWNSGKRLPSARLCYKLAEVFHANPDYVLALVGHISPAPQTATPRSFREVQLEYLARQPIEVPVYEGVSAREDRVADYSYLDPLRRAGRRISGLRVHGAAMAPDLLEGDVVFTDRDLVPRSGDLVVAHRGDEVLVRRYLQADDRPYLLAVGTGVRTSLEDAPIQGVIITLLRRFR